MKKIFSFVAATALAAGMLTSCQQGVQPNTLTEAEKAEGWQLLFDGQTLDGWRSYNRDTLAGGWHVVEGCIQASGEGSDGHGYIVTDKKFANFELVWDWKLTNGGNSGMLYHVVERPQFSVPYVTAPEYQLIDVEGWEQKNAPAKLEAWQKIGVDYAMHLPDYEKMHINPVGEWNSSKIIFDNGHVEHWLNGEKIVEFEAWTDDWFVRKASGKWTMAPEYGLCNTGLLCLQDHGDPASFRNIKIKELPAKERAAVAMFNGKDLTGWDTFGNIKASVDAEGNLVVENGEEKTEACIATRNYLYDFDFSVDVKSEGKECAPIWFHAFIPKKGKEWGEIAGWKFEIPEEKLSLLKKGDWNNFRITVKAGKVNTFINGEAVAEFTDEALNTVPGRILMQVKEGAETKMLYKNFKVANI